MSKKPKVIDVEKGIEVFDKGEFLLIDIDDGDQKHTLKIHKRTAVNLADAIKMICYLPQIKN